MRNHRGLEAVVLALGLAGAASMTAAERSSWMLCDFEGGNLVAVSGLNWFAVTDALVGGTSDLRLAYTTGGAVGSRGAMSVEGALGEKGYASGWVALVEGGRVADVSRFAGIRLRLRGPAEVSVGLRSGTFPGTNYMAPVQVGSGWSEHEVPFASLAPAGGPGKAFDPKDVRWLGVQPAPGWPSPFAFAVDDVQLYTDEPSVGPPTHGGGAALEARVPRTPASEVHCEGWTELSTDPAGDGQRASLPDAVGLDVCKTGDPLWVRIRLASPAPAPFIGINLVLDLDGQADNGPAWWGANKAFHFDRLVSFWAFHIGEEEQGLIGIADAAGVARSEMIDSRLPTPRIAIAPDGRAVFVAVPRSALGQPSAEVRLVAAVGSALAHNDDVPNAGAAILPR